MADTAGLQGASLRSWASHGRLHAAGNQKRYRDDPTIFLRRLQGLSEVSMSYNRCSDLVLLLENIEPVRRRVKTINSNGEYRPYNRGNVATVKKVRPCPWNQGKSRYTPEIIAEMRKKYRETDWLGHRMMEKEYGISRSYLYRICKCDETAS